MLKIELTLHKNSTSWLATKDGEFVAEGHGADGPQNALNNALDYLCAADEL